MICRTYDAKRVKNCMEFLHCLPYSIYLLPLKVLNPVSISIHIDNFYVDSQMQLSFLPPFCELMAPNLGVVQVW